MPWVPRPDALDGKEKLHMMRNKIVSETRAIGMYVFAMSFVITLAAFAYTLLFDVTGLMPVTRICNIIVICAAALGIAYAYVAADASQERRLARIYARRDAVVIATMAVYFVTGTALFGMVADATNHGLAIIPMLSEPAIMGGGLILGTSVIAMVALAILDHIAKKEIDEIGKREKRVFVKPVPKHVEKVVTTSDADNSNIRSKATYIGISYDPNEICNYIPLTQMGIANIQSDEGVLEVSAPRRVPELQEQEARRRESRRQGRAKRVAGFRHAAETVFGVIGAFIVAFFGFIFGIVVGCWQLVVSVFGWVASAVGAAGPVVRDWLAKAVAGARSAVAGVASSTSGLAHEKAPAVREKLDTCRDITKEVVTKGKDSIVTIADKTKAEAEQVLSHLHHADGEATEAGEELPEVMGEPIESLGTPAGDDADAKTGTDADGGTTDGDDEASDGNAGSCPIPETGSADSSVPPFLRRRGVDGRNAPFPDIEDIPPFLRGYARKGDKVTATPDDE